MTAFSQFLKTWRAARRFSQLDLALEAEISARHLSFLETGRAKPSREMVARLGEALGLPLDARNQMLTHAGFAVRYRGRDWDDADLVPMRRAISWQLERHLPYPGLALDRYWVVRDANPVARALLEPLGVGPGDSMIDLLTSGILPQVVENWSAVAHGAAMRLRAESAALGGVAEFDAAVRHLSKVAPPTTASAPVIPASLRQGETRISMFATISHFGTPEDLLLEDLKIELYFPMDAATEEVFRAMARSASTCAAPLPCRSVRRKARRPE